MRPLAILPALVVLPLQAELRLNALFTDHMVLQRDQPVRVWGWDEPGQQVTVTLDGDTATATAGGDGHWDLELPPRGTRREGLELHVVGSTERTVRDVLVGEVWLCSGQSNMQWDLRDTLDHDLILLREERPRIRLITVPRVGSQEAKDDFEGRWDVANAETAATFSSVGYHFGTTLAESLGDVPIGLIDNSWGGSAAEAWLRRDVFEADERNRAQIDAWTQREAEAARYPQRLADFERRRDEAQAAGRAFEEREPEHPGRLLHGNQRPGNLFNGVLHPLIGYGIRGVIWYQGETNASRPENYATLFPSLISHWREVWNQGDFPFYWVQLADFMDEGSAPGNHDEWARLRDAQTATLALPNTGQAVILDVGEAHDIHPPDKETVARRLARHALRKDYGFTTLSADSPRYASHEAADGKLLVNFDTFGSKLDTADFREVRGFALAGEDGVWKWALAEVVGDHQVAVHHPEVPDPVHVRYAWANNPVANLQNHLGLPATPFRTDGDPLPSP